MQRPKGGPLPLSTDRELAVDWQQSLVAGTRKGSDRERAADFVAGSRQRPAPFTVLICPAFRKEKNQYHIGRKEKKQWYIYVLVIQKCTFHIFPLIPILHTDRMFDTVPRFSH